MSTPMPVNIQVTRWKKPHAFDKKNIYMMTAEELRAEKKRLSLKLREVKRLLKKRNQGYLPPENETQT